MSLTWRHILIVLCVVQLVTTAERQVFDFLGYMWTPIICNFIHLILIIICLFGVCQRRPHFMLTYTIFCLMWIAWNVFVICLYLNIGSLNRNKSLHILNLSVGGKSWWLKNGIGCEVMKNASHSDSSSGGIKVPLESSVHGCVLPYYQVEVIHAAVQCFLAAIGAALSSVLVYKYWQDDDSSASADGELEYVKMRYKAPSRAVYPNDPYSYSYGLSSPHPVSPITVVPFDEEPPRYSDTVPDIATPEPDRRNTQGTRSMRSARSTHSVRSMRSARSTHSARSTRSNKTPAKNQVDRRSPELPRRDLPWVQITPSVNYNEVHLRSYDNYFV